MVSWIPASLSFFPFFWYLKVVWHRKDKQIAENILPAANKLPDQNIFTVKIETEKYYDSALIYYVSVIQIIISFTVEHHILERVQQCRQWILMLDFLMIWYLCGQWPLLGAILLILESLGYIFG